MSSRGIVAKLPKRPLWSRASCAPNSFARRAMLRPFSASGVDALGWMSDMIDTAMPLLSMSSIDISGDHLKVEPARLPPASSR